MKKTELIVLGLAAVAVWMIVKASGGTAKTAAGVRAGGGRVNPSDNPNWDPTKVYF
ncbi:hypothetical protein [Roseateles microcysteis]|uniref:hypothetical protein n=1 Tax=Roseateles microcysteis TaxID=3119057 RepID=UPI002FE65A34